MQRPDMFATKERQVRPTAQGTDGASMDGTDMGAIYIAPLVTLGL